VCRDRLGRSGFGDSTGRVGSLRVGRVACRQGGPHGQWLGELQHATPWKTAMDAAARVVGSDVVAGRGDLIRRGRGREGRGCSNVAPRWSSYPLGNVMGGLALQLDNSVQVDEWIRLGDISGRVAEIRWRYTSILTRDGETVLVPNGVLMKSQVTVLARGLQPGRWRRTVGFFVAFEHQPTDVIEAVESALRAASIPRVAESPPPDCILVELGDAQCRYAVRYWLTDPLADGPTDSVVRTRIYFALARARIPLKVRGTAVELTHAEPSSVDVRTEAELARCTQALRGIEVLRALDDQEIVLLARELRYAPFAGGEVMTRQGAEGHWLYLITDGTASVRVSVDGGLEREVARLGPGQFFGEISLMTGRPREATVIAVTDVECYRLGAEAFRRVLQAHPEKADSFAEVLAERAAALEAVRQGLDAEAKQRRTEHHRADLSTKIREFFGLD
jgi:CRP-like cAMP-binding protein